MREVALLAVALILTALLAGCAGSEEAEADNTSPVISAVSVSNRTPTSATITWRTDEPAKGSVEYGIPDSGDYTAVSEVASTELSTSHHVVLGELIPLE
jgi:hypothetical protein